MAPRQRNDPITLPGELYDTIEHLATELRGVGYGTAWKIDPNKSPGRQYHPVCIYGIVSFGCGAPVAQAMLKRGLTPERNDEIVRRYHRTTGSKRMPWSQYVKAFDIRRGPYGTPEVDELLNAIDRYSMA